MKIGQNDSPRVSAAKPSGGVPFELPKKQHDKRKPSTWKGKTFKDMCKEKGIQNLTDARALIGLIRENVVSYKELLPRDGAYGLGVEYKQEEQQEEPEWVTIIYYPYEKYIRLELNLVEDTKIDSVVESLSDKYGIKYSGSDNSYDIGKPFTSNYEIQDAKAIQVLIQEIVGDYIKVFLLLPH